MKTDLVQFQVEKNGLGILSLNRPEKLNALSAALLENLESVLQAAVKKTESLELKVLIIRSTNPKAFCVGADLAERIKMNEMEVIKTLDALGRVMNLLSSLPIPTLSVLEGAAFGGGLELALASDLRIAAPSAQMGLTETKLAIIPGAGGTQRLTRLVGVARAKELIFLARRLKAKEALACGLVNAVGAKPLVRAKEWAAEILKAGPLAVRAAKQAIERGAEMSLTEALAWERECYKLTLHSEDRREGLLAFREKREALYKGK